MEVKFPESASKRGLNPIKAFFILLSLAILTIVVLSVAAGSFEIVAEIIRLTPQVFIPLGMAVVLYLLGSSIFAIILWVTGKRKSAAMNMRTNAGSFWKKTIIIFALTVCIEMLFAYGALHISDNEEKITASLFRQLLYTGILFACTCVIIRSGRRKA